MVELWNIGMDDCSREKTLVKRREYRKYTSDDDAFIIANHATMSCVQMGAALSRSGSNVYGRKMLLKRDGLLTYTRPKPLVTLQEKDFLYNNLWTLGAIACAEHLNRPLPTVYAVAKNMGLTHNPINVYNRDDVSHFTSPSDPFVVYFLGLIWADGDISSEHRHRIKLKLKQSDFQDIHPHINRLGQFWHYRESAPKSIKWSIVSVLDATHLELWRFLATHSYRIKSGASAASILKLIPENLTHYWWRGYFDGDGSMSLLQSGVLSFNSGLNQDWTFVNMLEERIGIKFTIERSQRIGRGGSKALLSHYAYISRLIHFMYQGEDFGLKRKKLRCEQYMQSNRVKKPNLTSKYRGVSWCKRRKMFIMQISSQKRFYSETFINEEDAATAYDQHAIKFWGDKAKTNAMLNLL